MNPSSSGFERPFPEGPAGFNFQQGLVRSMAEDFEGFLEKYARHSDEIRDVRESDFSSFDMSKGDEQLVWDR